jgi:tetratricopeptide (TPR) repeat protein
MSYHPNWRVEGADGIYLVSPSFMLIYPKNERVRLYYGRGWPERVGWFLTALGLLVVLVHVPFPFRKRKSMWGLLLERRVIAQCFKAFIQWDPAPKTRQTVLILCILISALFIFVVCFQIYTGEPGRWFNRAVEHKDRKQFDRAREEFRRVASSLPKTNLALESAYYTAICYYLEERWSEAIQAFGSLIKDYPKGSRTPEAHYHIGRCHFRLGEEKLGIERMRFLIKEYTGNQWARFARDRLKERKAL